MVVLMNCLSSGSGGAFAYLRNILPPLADFFARDDAKHRLCILATSSQLSHATVRSGVQIVSPKRSKLSGSARLIWELTNLGKICSRTRADVLFTPYQVSFPVGKVKHVLMLRNMEPFSFRAYQYSLKANLRNRILEVATRKSLRRASRVIAVSEYVHTFARDHLNIPEERLRTIYHGRDPDFSPLMQFEDDEVLNGLRITRPYSLVCGSLLPYRRIEDVIAAWAGLKMTCTIVPTLVIAGTSSQSKYMDHLSSLVTSLGLNNHVNFLGHQDRLALSPLYRHANAVIMSSEVEACPNVAIEAMASGCPIICADVAPLRDMFHDAAVYYAPRDTAALARVAWQVFENEDLRQRLTVASLAMSRRFDWEHTVKATYSALTAWD